MIEPDPSDQQSEPTTQGESGFQAPEALVSGIVLGFVGLGLMLLLLRANDIEWTWAYWGSNDGSFNRSVIFRNFGLLFLALIALPLAGWRSWTAHQQARTANKQHLLSEKGLVIDRYQKGAQMLESEEPSVRLAGIYTLRDLAKSDPQDSYIMVLDLLFDFVREKPKSRNQHSEFALKDLGFPSDLQSALKTAGWLRKNSKFVNRTTAEKNWSPNLAGTCIDGAKIVDGDFSCVNFRETELIRSNSVMANLRGANFSKANVIDCVFTFSNLSAVTFEEARLENVVFVFSNLSGVTFRGVNVTDNIRVVGCWAFEDNKPKELPEYARSGLVYRFVGEAWPDFVDRIVRVQPNFGWSDSIKKIKTV
ncbi:hypothetical protein IWQ48_003825 [Labrenzia sp. EL_13]|nr:hypothetical protein [Labrenzia sp. EL_13]